MVIINSVGTYRSHAPGFAPRRFGGIADKLQVRVDSPWFPRSFVRLAKLRSSSSVLRWTFFYRIQKKKIRNKDTSSCAELAPARYSGKTFFFALLRMRNQLCTS